MTTETITTETITWYTDFKDAPTTEVLLFCYDDGCVTMGGHVGDGECFNAMEDNAEFYPQKWAYLPTGGDE